jgi:hypothetical protein
MPEYTKHESDTFFRQGVEEIAAELQLEESGLARALVEMRPAASHALKQRIWRITEMEPVQGIGQAGRLHRGEILRFLPRFALRAGAVAAILLVAFFMLIAAVPSARAAVGRLIQQHFQQRFGLVFVDTTQETLPLTETESSGTELEEGETLTEVAIPPLGLDEAQAQVAFTIPTPALLPEGFALWNTRVFTGPHGSSMDEAGNIIVIEPPVQIILYFKPDEANQRRYHPDATLSLTIFDRTAMEGGYGAPLGSAEEVEVNGNKAVFVRGIWEQVDESKPPSPDNITWDDTADSFMLSWEADGFTYVLQGHRLGLLREDFIRIAESVGVARLLFSCLKVGGRWWW